VSAEPTAASWFAEEWVRHAGTVLESLAGERPKLTCKPPAAGVTLSGACEETAREHGALLWWEYHFPLSGEPCIWIGAPRNACTQLAARVLGEAGVEDEAQGRETYVEILQQSLSELGRSAGRRWGLSLNCTAREATDAPADTEFWLVETTFPDATVPPLLVAVTGTVQPPGETAPAEVKAGNEAGTQGGVQIPSSRTFDLLMGVELPVSVSFGQVQLPLKEVLKLTAGSIIELNRLVDEPVEVIVNNCVVARGEVVVVEGNYGVRIHQIMSRQERLQSLP